MNTILLHPPTLSDGMAVFQLIEQCPPLDTNSSYCNLLQCSHFANTSVIAKNNDGEVMGFVSAYEQPQQSNTLFIWQVAIAEQARGQGLASKMLTHLLQRENLEHIQYIETSITKDNSASWALFTRLAANLSCELNDTDWMDKTTHFLGQHDSEQLVRVGPFNI